MFSSDDIAQSFQRIKTGVVETPCVYSPCLSEQCGARVYLKLESMQSTGSFKERGALNYLLAKRDEGLQHVVCASAGNHAQAVAMHAERLGISATIFMPKATPNNKILATERHHATVKILGDSYDDAYTYAIDFAGLCGGQYLHAYDDPLVILGQATVGYEIERQVGIPDYIFVPVGGGGLISGILEHFAHHKRRPHVVGVEVAGYRSMASALGLVPAHMSAHRTIAEGIAVKKVGALTKEICQIHCPHMVEVNDSQISSAIMLLLERQKIVSEGAAAATAAALSLPEFQRLPPNATVVLVVSGGNIDISLLNRLGGKELIKTKRLLKLSFTIKDEPGSLRDLLEIFNSAKGNIIDVNHERAFAHVKWNEVMVHVTVETKDEAHEASLLSKLALCGYDIANSTSEP